MLTHPTHERLITLGLAGMAKALEEQRRSPDLDALSFEDASDCGRSRSRRARHQTFTTRLKFAALRQSACVEDLDWRTPRGIDRVARPIPCAAAVMTTTCPLRSPLTSTSHCSCVVPCRAQNDERCCDRGPPNPSRCRGPERSMELLCRLDRMGDDVTTSS